MEDNIFNDNSSINYGEGFDSLSSACEVNTASENMRLESVFDCYTLPSFDELADIGLSNVTANNIPDDSRFHYCTDEYAHYEGAMSDSSFLGNSITDSRNRYASDLEDELSYKHIHISGSYKFDSEHGGFDRTTGQKIHDAIVKARGEGRISDYTYKRLIDKLDDACYYQ